MKKFLLIILATALMIFNQGPSAEGKEMQLKTKDVGAFFKLLNKDTMYLVDQFYAQDVHFKDPIVEFNTRDDLKHYYSSAYEGTDTMKFDVPSVINQGDEQVIIWIMTMTSKKLNKGKPIVVEGSSYIRYNDEGKAVYHRDYFDMGQMVYSHVPFVRGMVRFVNTRMKKKHHPTYKRKDQK